MNILVIRFRQMGDAVMTTIVLNSLRQTFPDAHIDFVLNERIAPLFEHHPSIDRIITFSEKEKHSFFTYIRKVWKIVRQTRYDIIIDKRSTPNTLPFTLFSLRTPWRIGQRKPYTRFICNHRITPCQRNESMVHHMMETLRPLEALRPVTYVSDISLGILPDEIADFRHYMVQQGIDFNRPVALVGVAAKLTDKMWPVERMAELIGRVMEQFPQMQLVFNYAPGHEAETARDIYERLGHPRNVFIDIEARSARQLAAMSVCVNVFFGNEGGARHIVHAMGCPNFVVCSPSAPKAVWIPRDTSVPAEAVAPSDFATEEERQTMTTEQQYDLLTTDRVWQPLHEFLCRVL